MYVAVKGGEKAIDTAHQLMAEQRRGNTDIPELTLDQIREQMTLAVDRVMTEGSLYDRDLAALAIKQARGDLMEAIFLLRAYRTTLPRLGVTEPLNTDAMRIIRRISATFKDLPGGQILGPTFDYTHRLLDFALAAEGQPPTPVPATATPPAPCPRVTSLLNAEGLIEPDTADDEGAEDGTDPGDITREPPLYPADRAVRLQTLARADEGWLLALGYSTQRGYAKSHPFAGEIRIGSVDVEIIPEELGFPVCIGTLEVAECEMINQFKGSKTTPPQFTRGYGLTFGHGERKAMSMALVDRALRARELGEDIVAPAQDEEFVLSHGDSVESSGFTQHLKLPHYVDFQSELVAVRALRAEYDARRRAAETAGQESQND